MASVSTSPDAGALGARSGLRRKIWIAFILQVAAISFATVLGVYGASAVLKHLLIQRALTDEAAHYWQRHARDPQAALPDTFNMMGFMQHGDDAVHGLPDELRSLEPGYHTMPRALGGSLVLVDERDGERLYLLFKQDQVDSLAFWFGMVPLTLVLAVIYVIAWITYRASRSAVSPVIWLANTVSRWDPKKPDARTLDPAELPVDMEGETLVLANSLHDFTSRIEQFIERERNFTRDASHELRTPLTVIRMACDILAADPCLTAPAARSVKRIQGAGRDMEALIEAFLIIAREGDVGLPDEDFAVGAMIEEELEKARPLVATKPIELAMKSEGDFVLHAPPRVFSVLVGNLLRNACHYTDAGRVVVHVRPGEVVVEDTGIGMTPEELARVFEPFWRANDGQRPGQGIGLSIVQRLSERFGWPVRLESERGVGTRAIVSFPRHSPPEA
jgi:signal transduction histidine kinase